MKLLYLSVHSILEHDEVKLLTELGHKVFSPHGAYENPSSPNDPKRPALPTNLDPAEHQQLMDVSRQSERETLHPELMDWCDAVIVMHKPEWIPGNLDRGKPIILRTIGQNIEPTENFLREQRARGLKIVRYSPKEQNIPGYVGEDALIRFYKDPEEFKDWNGNMAIVTNFTQSMPQRGAHCSYDLFKEVHTLKEYPLPFYLYGPGNEDSGFPGGLVSYDQQKEILRNSRVYFYTGTQPASYTLGFIEAMMTGVPIVSIGKDKGNSIYHYDLFEVPDIIQQGVSGFYSDDPLELHAYLNSILNDRVLSQTVSEATRVRAIELFGVDKIKAEWRVFLESINHGV